jgi:hypothetical protein
MDPIRFDRLARSLFAASSRRRALGALLAGLVAPLLPDPAETAARKRGKRRRRDGRNRQQGRPAKGQRQGQTRAAATAATCCERGACTPGAGQDLSQCCFEQQNLAGANFGRSDLGGASLRGAVLTGANFNRANLSKACLVDADLTGATFTGATRKGVIYCRTQTDSGENNAGCGQGTPCCPTCDAGHPCGPDRVCCRGRCIPGNCCDNGTRSTCAAGELCCGNRCVAGDCCGVDDCATETCQRRACRANRCVYTPVSGTPGPRCPSPRVCCEDDQGNPICCRAGVRTCQPSGLCGCGGDTDCDADQRCCRGTCIPKTTCCEGNNAEGCNGDRRCCVVDGTGVCGACCNDGQCRDEVCETKTCAGDRTCRYTPVFREKGPGCDDTVCCRDASGAPECCGEGTTVCTASGRCRCAGNGDCTTSEICCNGSCIANTRCCDGTPSTCPAPPGVCQVRACANGACQPRGVSGGSCPLPVPGGGTGTCRDGACVCPGPRITCNNVCCIEGVTQCNPDGTCPRLCDVCPSGCTFTTVAAAVAGTPAGGTIRICPGTYATLDVRIEKNLTIVGAGSGADGTILDGQLTNRIFTVSGAPDAVVTVTIRDLAVTRGRPPQQANTGAGISVVFDVDLTLDRVEVTDNAVPSGFGLGAIAVAPRSSLLLKESRVANNLNFAFGGGINTGNEATVTLEASRIEGNSAGFGGGIWINDSGTVNLDDDSIVTENHAQNPSRGAGGGIYNKGRVNGATPGNVTGNTRGNPPLPDNCANAPRIPGSGFGTGCPA